VKPRAPRFTGLAAWWIQRTGAVYMLAFAVFVLVGFLLHPPHSHAEWQSSLAHPAIRIAVLGFFAALLSHLWVGLRDVLLDYARPAALRRFLLLAVAAGIVAIALWVSWILLLAASPGP
jgi:succinate dehydrogenase / fumarate reductase membrane anchor subunit